MLTKDLLFGMNIVTLAGFLVMGVGLTLIRQRRIRTATAFALMGTGTALAFVGTYLAPPTMP
jgi:uncharacterized membrane protein YozB (DUF420 family)